MINQTLIWLLLLPFLLGAGLWFAVRSRIGSVDKIKLSGIVVAVAFALTATIFLVGKGAKTMDVEIINGQVTSKSRDHGTYEQAYQCNCRMVTTGYGKDQTTTQVCDTCYETHYTVKWTSFTTIGDFVIDSEDSTSRSVYNTADPVFYLNIQKGDPASDTHRYTNYVQAVPESLFTPTSTELKKRFAMLVPSYPGSIYNHYTNDHVLSPGLNMADRPVWNREVALMLRDLGPAKQVNAIIVFAKTDDPNYEYALRDAWENGNKNDVIVVIGTKNYPAIDFVRVISWTKKELFKIELRDDIQKLGTVQHTIVPMIAAQITKNFERRHMSEFEYLDGEIDPPTWVMIIIVIIQLAGFGFVFYKTQHRRW